MGVDAVVFYRIKQDEMAVKASQYAVASFAAQIDTLARTVLRDIIGGMDMAIANTSRPIINASLKNALDEQTEKWGIEIVRAEIKDLEPPRELIVSMESVLKADNERQAGGENRHRPSNISKRTEKRCNSSCRRPKASSNPSS
jgi:regulator of protease activity HflC (stomatin/prohibitin superfamily)